MVTPVRDLADLHTYDDDLARQVMNRYWQLDQTFDESTQYHPEGDIDDPTKVIHHIVNVDRACLEIALEEAREQFPNAEYELREARTGKFIDLRRRQPSN